MPTNNEDLERKGFFVKADITVEGEPLWPDAVKLTFWECTMCGLAFETEELARAHVWRVWPPCRGRLRSPIDSGRESPATE
jgi:hypothetical protein